MPPDEEIVESSPTPEVEEPKAPALSDLTDKQYHDWRLTGKMPKAESSPAGETQDSPTNEPQVKKKSATESWAELRGKREEAERRAQQAEAELERLRAGGERRADPPPAKATPKLEPPKKPEEKDFTDWQKFQDARDQYFEDLADYKAAKKLEEFKAENVKNHRDAIIATQNAEIENKVAERLAAAKQKFADFDKVTKADGGLPITSGGTLDAFLLDTEHLGDFMYYLGSHRDECKEINQAPPWKAARMLIALEAKLGTSGTPAKPPVKRVTTASPPARELGNGSGTPPDDPIALSARHASNPRAYIDEMNRREVVLKRGR